MICITYEILSGYAVIRRIFSVGDGGTAPAVMLEFGENLCGTVTVGDRSYRLTDGKAKIPLADLCDGKHLPTLRTDKQTTACEGFLLSGKVAEGAGPDPAVLRKALYRIAALEETVARLSADCEAFDRRINGTVLF